MASIVEVGYNDEEDDDDEDTYVDDDGGCSCFRHFLIFHFRMASTRVTCLIFIIMESVGNMCKR